ncbi:MAG: ABC transporter ATP-binding protein [Myxococcota bacterium]
MSPPENGGLRRFFEVFRYTRRALGLVWDTHRGLTVAILLLSLAAGLLPAGVAYVGKLIVDAVVQAIETGAVADRERALWFVGLELGLVALIAGAQRGLDVSQSLLRALLGQKVNELILERALTLELAAFEDPEFYDRMVRARREASTRPLSLVRRTFGLVQNAISLAAYSGLLFSFSPWAVGIIALAAVPAFLVETRFSNDAFRLFRWRAPEARRQMYLETVLAREDYAKEVKLFGLGPLLLERYRSIFRLLYGEDRRLTLRRGAYGYVLGLVSSGSLYFAYGWIAVQTVDQKISLGDMTMYLLLFKQGQSALSSILTGIGGMYEDNLYLSNLYEFLEEGAPTERLAGETVGPRPGDGLRLEAVSYRYPDAKQDTLRGVDLHVPPGTKLAIVGQNGAGKTTLIKLITGLYQPTRGRVLLDGLEIERWAPEVLRERIGVIFQDFVRYQLQVGENIGAGDVRAFDDEARQRAAAHKGMAEDFIEDLPEGFETQLGRWFGGGQELSLGQWQKIALSRAFMRTDADLLIFDEPTHSMDADAESLIFDRVRNLADDRMAILISHRFSTVRMADRIAVLSQGRVSELGTHDELMARAGGYQRMFTLQAEGYQ